MTKNEWKPIQEGIPEEGKVCDLRLLTLCEGIRISDTSFKVDDEKTVESQVIAWKYKDENN